MKNAVSNQTNQYRTAHRKHRRWLKVVTVMAAVVVFCTTYALILPAITWEKQLICEVPEHTHTASCYQVVDGAEVLACDKQEHTHDAACFDAPPAAEQTPTEERVLTAKAGGVEFTAQGVLPQDAVLKVQALTAQETGKIGKTLGTDAGKQAFAYDIKIVSEGKEFEPESNVNIAMRGIDLRDGEHLQGYHLHGVDAADVKDLQKNEVQPEKFDVSLGENEAEFATADFSVFYFTVEFTVDFSYNNITYSIDGKSDGIALSALMKELKMEKTIADLTDLKFEGEATQYVNLTKNGNDWNIVPTGEPFDVFGELTLTFDDGTTAVIGVADSKIDTRTFNEGETLVSSGVNRHVLKEGSVITINGTVKVDSQIEFENNVTLKLSDSFPAGKVALQFTNADAVLTENGNNCSLTILGNSNGPFIIDGGAKWTGTVNKTLNRGQENSGLSRNKSLIQLGVQQLTDNMEITTHVGLSLTLNNVQLQNNAFTKKNAAATAQQGGGAVYLNNRTGAVNFTNVKIKDCYHVSNGGAIMMYDNMGHAQLARDDTVDFKMTNCEVSGCDSGYDGNETSGIVGGTIKTTGRTFANLILDNCYFHNNYSTKQGGGIVWYVGSEKGKLTVKNSRFIGNKAGSSGGAIDNRSVMTLEGDCLFQNNSATNGGAIYLSVYGGGAGATGDKEAMSLYINSGTVIKQNTASGNGGGVAFYGTAGTVSGKSRLSVVMNGGQILNNKAANGGGLYFSKNADAEYNTSIEFNDGLIANNTATKAGGGIYVTRPVGDTYVGTIDVKKGEISGNTAPNGGGIYCDQTNIDFGATDKMYIKGNTATNGGGLYLNGASSTTEFKGESHVDDNVAQNGGGGAIYINNGAKLYVTGGVITNNVATGTDGDMGTTGNLTAFNNQNTQKGVGGGVYLANGYFQLGEGAVQTEQQAVGIWGNIAYLAADDMYASGNGTTLNLPDTRLMTLSEAYDIKDVKWVEDYYKNDTAYATNWPGHTTNKGRYRDLDIDTEGASVNMAVPDMNLANAYICTTIGPVKWAVYYYNKDGTERLHGPERYNHMQRMTVGTYGGYFTWTTEPNNAGTAYNTGDLLQVKDTVHLYASFTDVGSLRIMETVQKATGALDPPLDDEFTFTVTLPDGEYDYTIYSTNNDVVISTGKISSGGTITLRDDQYAVISGLPEKQPYSVQPTSKEDYDITGVGATGKIQKGTTVSADFVSTYTKRLETATFQVQLTGDNGALLPGATFELYELIDGEWVLLDTIETDENGIASYESIAEDTRYKLIEKTPPGGYLTERSEVYFEMDENGLFLTDISGTPLGGLPDYIADLTKSTEGGTNVVTMKFLNRAGVLLPSTGGFITPYLYAAGTILWIGLAISVYILRRKRERRSTA